MIQDVSAYLSLERKTEQNQQQNAGSNLSGGDQGV